MRSLLNEISMIKSAGPGGIMSLDNSINNDMSLFPQEDEESKYENSSLSVGNNLSQQEKTAATTLDFELF